MVDTFKKPFINAGIVTQLTLPANLMDTPGSILDLSNPILNTCSFNCMSLSASEVQQAMLGLDCKRSPGPNQIEPYFLQTTSNLISGPIACLQP